MTDDRYERVTWRGHTFDRMTVAALEELEARLGYELTILQGSYNAGVGASAGTHDGGGAVDLSPLNYNDKVLAARHIGFVMWHRPYWPGEWQEHCHGILRGNTQASESAKNQIVYYDRGEDGLADHARDNAPTGYHIDVKPFVYEPDVKWNDGDVYVVKLQFGMKHSDSVKRLQYRLQHHQELKRGGLVVDGAYGPNTRDAVADWQRHYADHGPNDGKRVVNIQAAKLFGPAYTVVEDPHPDHRKPGDRAAAHAREAEKPGQHRKP